MDVAIGLPNTVPGTTGEQLIEFARRAEAAGFSALSTIDRVAYPNLEPLTALAAAAAVTERIKLMTTIAIAPYRLNLAKQAASVDKLSNGRLWLGVAAGNRENDYVVSGVDFESRYQRFEQILGELKDSWANSGNASGDPTSEAVGPDVSEDPPKLLIGGHTPVTFRRVAQYGDGFVAAGAPPDQFAQLREGVEAAWAEAGREGKPYLGGQIYFALGEHGAADARAYLGDYYTWLGDDIAQFIVDSAAKDADTVKHYLQAFGDAGCQELIFFPSSSDPVQVDLLAEVAL